MPDAADNPPDEILIKAARVGDLAACEALYRRHAGLARRVARRCDAEPADQEDLIAEAFVRVLTAIRAGGGPADNLRPYLVVTIRNLAASSRWRDRRLDWNT